MAILSAPCLALAAVILSLCKPAQAAPKFLLVETEVDPKDANEAGKDYPKNDLDKDIDEDNTKDEGDTMEASTKALTKAGRWSGGGLLVVEEWSALSDIVNCMLQFDKFVGFH